MQVTQGFNTSSTEDSNTSLSNVQPLSLTLKNTSSYVQMASLVCCVFVLVRSSCPLVLQAGQPQLFQPLLAYQMLQNPAGPLLDLLQFAMTFTLGNSEIGPALQNVK